MPNDATGYEYLGDAFYKNNEPQRAMEEYNKILKLQPSVSDIARIQQKIGDIYAINKI